MWGGVQYVNKESRSIQNLYFFMMSIVEQSTQCLLGMSGPEVGVHKYKYCIHG